MYMPGSSEWTTELTAQHLSSYKGQTVPSSSSLTPVYPESPHKGEIRWTFGGHPSGTKIAEEETGSNPYCSAAAAGDPQASRARSGPQQSYSRGARLLEGELRNRNNFIINNLDIHSETQSENQELHRCQVDKSTKMGRNQCEKEENTRNQNTSPPTRYHNSSPAREQSWMEKECDEMTKSDFRRWVMRNFCKLKQHVLTQCKETKNTEKRFDKMLTRMDNLEIWVNWWSWKTQHKNFVKYAQALTVKLIKQKKGYQRLKTNSMK